MNVYEMTISRRETTLQIDMHLHIFPINIQYYIFFFRKLKFVYFEWRWALLVLQQQHILEWVNLMIVLGEYGLLT